jgi:hypothetical protein
MTSPPNFESAFDWNRRHPPGTRVVLQLADGRSVSTATKGWAVQWGSFAVIELCHVQGLWTTSALVVAPDLFDDTPAAILDE